MIRYGHLNDILGGILSSTSPLACKAYCVKKSSGQFFNPYTAKWAN